MVTYRTIIKIDEEKCDGCGQCAEACPEGAIQIIDGKARLAHESYCDGLGVCIGECPQGAITLEERVAEEFDQEAVEQHLANPTKTSVTESKPSEFRCPGSLSRTLHPAQPSPETGESEPLHSFLGNWPVQLHLVPVRASYFHNARLLIAADCAPFAFADFHRRFLAGRTLLVGCPKLDDAQFYLQKLTQMFQHNDIRSIEVVYMEVPCCHGLARLAQLAVEQSGKKIPVTLVKIGIRGDGVEVEHSETGSRNNQMGRETKCPVSSKDFAEAVQ